MSHDSMPGENREEMVEKKGLREIIEELKERGGGFLPPSGGEIRKIKGTEIKKNEGGPYVEDGNLIVPLEVVENLSRIIGIAKENRKKFIMSGGLDSEKAKLIRDKKGKDANTFPPPVPGSKEAEFLEGYFRKYGADISEDKKVSFYIESKSGDEVKRRAVLLDLNADLENPYFGDFLYIDLEEEEEGSLPPPLPDEE